MRINKKMNELYVGKSLTLLIPYRKKTRRVSYMVTGTFGTQFEMGLQLKSKKHPCEIPHLQLIEMELKNEFPTKKQMEIIRRRIK